MNFEKRLEDMRHRKTGYKEKLKKLGYKEARFKCGKRCKFIGQLFDSNRNPLLKFESIEQKEDFVNDRYKEFINADSIEMDKTSPNKNIPLSQKLNTISETLSRVERISNHPRLNELLEMMKDVFAKDNESPQKLESKKWGRQVSNGKGRENETFSATYSRNYIYDFFTTKSVVSGFKKDKWSEENLSKIEADLSTLDNHPDWAKPQREHEDSYYEDKPKEMSDEDWEEARMMFDSVKGKGVFWNKLEAIKVYLEKNDSTITSSFDDDMEKQENLKQLKKKLKKEKKGQSEEYKNTVKKINEIIENYSLSEEEKQKAKSVHGYSAEGGGLIQGLVYKGVAYNNAGYAVSNKNHARRVVEVSERLSFSEQEEMDKREDEKLRKILTERISFLTKDEAEEIVNTTFGGFQKDVLLKSITNELARMGHKPYYISKGKSFYYNIDSRKVRVSDHELPTTMERVYKTKGLSSFDEEIIADKYFNPSDHDIFQSISQQDSIQTTMSFREQIKILREKIRKSTIEQDVKSIAIEDTSNKDELISSEMKSEIAKYPILKGIEDDITYKMGYDAHSGTSFSPEVRAKQVVYDYVSTVLEQYKALESIATTDEHREDIEIGFKEFMKGYKTRYIKMLGAKSRIMSVMITGAGNFPVARMKKLNGFERTASDDVYSYVDFKINKIKSKINGTNIIKSSDDDALDKLNEKLKTLEDNQTKMKDANKVIKNKKLSDEEKVKQLIEIGINEKSSKELLAPNYAGRKGYASFNLTNNNAKIKSAKSRIVELEKAKEVQESGGTTDKEYDGLTVHENFEEMRIQLLFDEKPTSETRDILKKKGFRWSGKHGAWQRHLNNNGKYATEQVVKELGLEEVV